MSSITATPVAGSGYTRVEVDWSDIAGPPRKAWVYRVLGGVATPLRDADPALLSNGKVIVYDTEAPLDTAVTYQSSIALNANGDFEDGVSEWLTTANSGTVGTVTQSFDYYVRGEGRASAKLVGTGAQLTVRAASEFVPATAGVTYNFSAQIMLTENWNGGVGLLVHWYNGTTFLSSSGAMTDLWPTPGEFATYSFSATAPATTTNMRIVPGMTGTPPAATIAYIDEAYITRTGVTTITTGSTTLASNGNGWWKDPLHPATMVKLLSSLVGTCPPTGTVYGGIGGITRAADSSLLDINDGEYPVSTWAQRKSAQSQMVVGTASLADLAAVRALHAPGAPLLLQLPSTYGIADHYQQHGDLAENYLGLDQRKPWRRLQSGFATVLAPVGPAEGVLGTRYQDINKWSTYAQVEAFGGGAADSFNRTVVDSWGTPDVGPAYTYVGTTSDFDVANGRGTVTLSAISTNRIALLGLSLATVRARIASAQISAAPTGTTTVDHYIRLRYVDANNFVEFRVFRDAAANTITTLIRSVIAGVDSPVSAGAVAGLTDGSDLSILFEANGTTIRGKVWSAGGVEPTAWTQSVTTAHTSAGGVNIGTATGSGITGLPYVASYEDIAVANLSASAGNTWWDLLQGEGYV